MPVLLGVNIDHVATVREARGGREPEPVAAAVLAELGGADGITVHLRGDRRHIKERDLHLLKDVICTKLNLEMAATPEMVRIAKRLKPYSCTLVPEEPDELTTQGGLDVISHQETLKEAIAELQAVGIVVSIFIDADSAQIKAAKAVGANFIEIHTGIYADAETEDAQREELQRIMEASRLAQNIDLRVNAGHGLNYQNVKPIAEIPGVVELNIGHSIVSRAVLVGMERAVREMKELIS